MSATLREAVRERATLRAVGSVLVALGVLRLVVDASVPQLATTATLGAVTGLADIVEDVYDVRESVTSGWVGAVAVVGSVPLLAFGGGPGWFSVTLLVAGGWFLLDAVQTARHEGLTEDDPDGREVYRNYVARRTHETLAERPHTRRELCDALDADDETVEAALDRLRERDVVEQTGSEFRVRSSETGRLGRGRRMLADLGRRVARPVTLELESGDETGEHGDRSATRDDAGTGWDAREQADSDPKREPERESVD